MKKYNTVDKHIKFPEDLYNEIDNYSRINGYDFSECVRKLIEIGLNKVTYGEIVESNNKILDRVYGRLSYCVDLMEQLYADMGIDDSVDTKKSNSLKAFKNKKYSDIYDK